MNHFIEVSLAKKIIEGHIQPTRIITLPLLHALGYYTAAAVMAPVDVPPFDNSAMDGYAFALGAIENQDPLQVIGEVKAGACTQAVQVGRGEALRIFTGAQIPEGADTVIPQEKVDRDKDSIHFEASLLEKGANIRLRASQTKKGSQVLPSHTLINAGTIGFLAGMGIAQVRVFDTMKIGLLYTGNELAEAGAPLLQAKIYDSNTYTIQAALAETGHQLSFLRHVEDSRQQTVLAIKEALAGVDVLLISGGISVGEYDFVHAALEENGVKELLYTVRQKPGKPLYFGKKGKKYVFALPGNPAALFSCYHLYVKPFLLGCRGRADFYQELDHAELQHETHNKISGLTLFLKARFAGGKVSVLGSQESYKTDALVLANCFVEFPAGAQVLQKGAIVRIWKI